MKRLFLSLALVPAFACAPDTSVLLGNVLVTDANCTATATGSAFKGGGSMDLALTTAYVASFEVASQLEPLSTTVGTDVIVGPAQNDFILSEMDVKYSSTPAGSFADQTLFTYFVIPAGTAFATTNFVSFNLIGPQTGQQLLAAVPAGGQPLQLFVTLQGKGKLRSGQPLSTNPVTYPITVVHSAPCPSTTPYSSASGPAVCGNPGQDGAVQVCSATPPTTTP